MAIETISPYSQTTTSSTTKTSNNTLSMDDFFELMVAEMSNQDMNNPMDNTQFINQMAQFSMIQALSDLSAMASTSYSVGLIGKEVTVAEPTEDGMINSVTGIVESVNLYNGAAKVVVEGNSYDLSSVMIVKEPDILYPDFSSLTEDLLTEAGENE
jgi:flagellar basal-body rod modification protein FlgD